jgi:hypothetical protein
MAQVYEGDHQSEKLAGAGTFWGISGAEKYFQIPVALKTDFAIVLAPFAPVGTDSITCGTDN